MEIHQSVRALRKSDEHLIILPEYGQHNRSPELLEHLNAFLVRPQLHSVHHLKSVADLNPRSLPQQRQERRNGGKEVRSRDTQWQFTGHRTNAKKRRPTKDYTRELTAHTQRTRKTKRKDDMEDT